MERISDLKFHRMRSRSPAKSRKPFGHAQPSNGNSRSSSTHTSYSTATQPSLTNSPPPGTTTNASSKAASTRNAVASSTSLQDLYHRHRRRSSSQRNRPRASDPSCTEEDFRYFMLTKQPGLPYTFCYGRRYLLYEHYFLPSDLQETQRQNLATMLSSAVLGGPLCSSIDPLHPPRKILEVGCGAGYWSSVCHGFLSGSSAPAPAFIGMDVADTNPDLKSFGIDWTFVQHDMYITPFPFSDSSFDIVMFKGMAAATMLHKWDSLLTEFIRILRPGGVLEVREMDYRCRRMLPPQDPATASAKQNELSARQLGCYAIHSETEFAPCQNKFVQQFSSWSEEAMTLRDLCPIPVAFCAEKDTWVGFSSWDSKRVAIPLSPFLNWEKVETSPSLKAQSQIPAVELTEEQRAIRATALDIVLGRVEALEPLLREECGKNEEEWRRWWNCMVINVLEENGCASGECLEVGGWWGKKPGKGPS